MQCNTHYALQGSLLSPPKSNTIYLSSDVYRHIDNGTVDLLLMMYCRLGGVADIAIKLNGSFGFTFTMSPYHLRNRVCQLIRLHLITYQHVLPCHINYPFSAVTAYSADN